MDEAIRQLMMQMQMRQMLQRMSGGQPGATPVELDPYENERKQAYNAWLSQAPFDEVNDEISAQLERQNKLNPPGYAEGQVMPPPASRRAGYEAYGAEIEAQRGQLKRDQDLHDALRMRGFGSTIPTVEAQQNSMFGTPISDTFLQRPPLAPGVGAASAPQAWFENPPWLQGEPPESYGRISGPYPGPAGLSGDYSRGKLFGPQSPLRGTVRQSFPF